MDMVLFLHTQRSNILPSQAIFVAKIESPTQAFGVLMETLFKIAEALEVPVLKLFEE